MMLMTTHTISKDLARKGGIKGGRGKDSKDYFSILDHPFIISPPPFRHDQSMSAFLFIIKTSTTTTTIIKTSTQHTVLSIISERCSNSIAIAVSSLEINDQKIKLSINEVSILIVMGKNEFCGNI